METRHDIAVRVQRQRDIGVSENALHNTGMDAFGEHYARKGVSEVMNTLVPNTSGLQQLVILANRRDMLSQGAPLRREHEPRIDPPATRDTKLDRDVALKVLPEGGVE